MSRQSASKQKLVIFGALLASVGMGAGALWLLREAPSASLAYAVAPGRYFEHDVRIDEVMRVVPFSPTQDASGAAAQAAPMEAVTHVDVRLRLEGVRAGDPGLARARFTAVRTASTVLGKQELLGATALVGPVAEVEIGRDGLPRSIRAPESEDPTFARVLTLVLNESALPLGTGSTWQATERNARGTLAATVRVTAARDEEVALSRTRTITSSTAPRAASAPRAPTLSGESQARVRRDGVTLSLDVNEASTVHDAQGAVVEARTARVTVAFVGEGASAVDAPIAALAQAQDPASVGDTDALGKRSLERRTEGLTREALDRTMTDAIVNGRAPDHAKFLWRAAARLKLDDAAVDDLAKQFERTDATTPGRALALDLLAAANSAHAQEALVALVQTPFVENDVEASRLKQRLALVTAPSPATIDFLIAKSSEPSGSWRDPARIALGAAVRHRRELGDIAEAMRARDALVEQTRALEDDRETEVAVLALGNTYDPDVASFIVNHASSARAQTRHVVAEALREIDAPLARDTLLQLARDPAPEVSRRALMSLARHALDDTHLSALASAIAAEQVPDTVLHSAVGVVEKRANEASSRAVLEAVLARKPEPQLAARVRHLLRGI